MSKHRISTDDQRLFRETVGDVVPVTTDTVMRPTHRRAARREPTPEDTGHGAPPAATPRVGQEDTLQFTVDGVPATTLRRLRQGTPPPEATLDLHGATQASATRALAGFLQRAYAHGARCVCIVHGKGHGSRETVPVLKNCVNAWLRAQPEVLAFCSAPPAFGGAGAALVLLRRNRQHAAT